MLTYIASILYPHSTKLHFRFLMLNLPTIPVSFNAKLRAGYMCLMRVIRCLLLKATQTYPFNPFSFFSCAVSLFLAKTAPVSSFSVICPDIQRWRVIWTYKLQWLAYWILSFWSDVTGWQKLRRMVKYFSIKTDIAGQHRTK